MVVLKSTVMLIIHDYTYKPNKITKRKHNRQMINPRNVHELFQKEKMSRNNCNICIQGGNFGGSVGSSRQQSYDIFIYTEHYRHSIIWKSLVFKK